MVFYDRLELIQLASSILYRYKNLKTLCYDIFDITELIQRLPLHNVGHSGDQNTSNVSLFLHYIRRAKSSHPYPLPLA